MISLFLKVLFNFAIGLLIILIAQNYLNFSPNFPNIYLYGGLLAWLISGTLIGLFKYKDTSMFSIWLYPTQLITPPIVFYILFFTSALSLLDFNTEVGFYLLWIFAPSLTFAWVICLLRFSLSKAKTPFFPTLITVAHIQIFLILTTLATLYLDNRPLETLFEIKTTLHYILTFTVFGLSLSLVSVYVEMLREFTFFEKAEHLLSQASHLDYETRKMVATHEAGHCLCYCFFKTPPEQIKIYLYEQALARQEGSYGLVEAFVPILNTQDYDEFRLLVMLGGQRAELSVHKKTSKGASADVTAWKAAAHAYLVKYNKSYSDQPENDAQMTLNTELEKKLFNRHIEILDLFFKKNKGLVIDLASKAYRFNPLEAYQIHPYLKKAVITKNFPKEGKKKLW
jgi:hypothetical protein